jgi:hypothetical protein
MTGRLMLPADAEEYTQALAQVWAGGWRQAALGKRLGVPAALGLTTEEWVQQRLGGYVRLSIPDRREAVTELTGEGMSSREIGDVLGVDHTTVIGDRRAGENSPPEPANGPPSEDIEPSAGEDSPAGPESLPEIEPQPVAGVVELAPEPEPVDEPTTHSMRARRSKARQMLAKAAAATSELSPSVDVIAEAVVARHPDEIAAERENIIRNRAVWDRLLDAVNQQANPQLRRVK